MVSFSIENIAVIIGGVFCGFFILLLVGVLVTARIWCRMAIRRSLHPRPCVVVSQPGTIAAVETDCQYAPLIVPASQTITCVSSTTTQQQQIATQVFVQ